MLMNTPDRKPERTAAEYQSKVEEKMRAFDYYQQTLLGRRAQEIRWWRRYLTDTSLVDTRSEDEKKWRSLVMLPYGYSGIQSLVAHLVDMLMGPSPVLTTRGRGSEDVFASANERLTNYTFVELNRLSAFAEEAFTRGCIQGMDVWKMSWRDEWAWHDFRPTAADERRFAFAVNQAVQLTGIEPPAPDDEGQVDRRTWEIWCSQVADAGVYIPAIPAQGRRKVRSFIGPWLRSVELYDLAYDPKVADFQRQHCLFYRAIVPRAWLLRQAQDHPERYDGKAIEALPKAYAAADHNGTVSDHQMDYLDALGIGQALDDDPYYQDAVEVIEFTDPQSDDFAWGIVGNHNKLITRAPEDYPYKWRRQPYSVYYNVPTPGAAVGISEYQPNGLLHEAADKMLMATVDYALLQTMPVLKHTQGLGLGGPITFPKPGDMVELDPEEKLEQAFDFSKPLSVSTDTIRFIKGEIDETSGVFSSVRGAPAEINRVSATESQGRQNASMARPKGRLYRFADALQPMIQMSLGMWKQFGQPDQLVNIAGLDPSTALSEDGLLQGMQENYVTAAAAVQADAAMQVKQFDEGIQALGPQGLGVLQPGGQAALAIAKARLTLSRTPLAVEIVQAIKQDQLAAQQAQQQQAAAAPAPGGAPAAPGEPEQPAPEGGQPPPEAAPPEQGQEVPA